ncbi:hypothetical protein [Thalassotalea sp. SU-HH00458]|uniref:hypothetical protein n=1 Tax=Thalassotalea sp. SU-HH00458 TaxID=3127657 RepID=UPI00310C269C
MLFRRVLTHVKDQNWFAVGIDFCIVVVGVVIGIQVSNWNTVRNDTVYYQETMHRLAEESREMIRISEEQAVEVHQRLSTVQAAISILETCSTDENAKAKLELGLNAIRSAYAITPISTALKSLVSDERLLARQTSMQRSIIREYAVTIENITETSSFILSKTGILDVDKHPLVGFYWLNDPAKSLNGVDVRNAIVVAPLAEVCKDLSFKKLFYQWERTHNFLIHLQNTLLEVVSENSKTLGLPLAIVEPSPST